MSEVKTTHHTVVVRRSYEAEVSDVYAAWADATALEHWHMPGDKTWTSKIESHEFRVGGRRLFSFGPPGGPRYREDCRYEDIVAERRLCYAMTIMNEGVRITTSMVTVEFEPRGDRADLVVTDQLVILDGGDSAGDRERGWGETLDKLTPYLRGKDAGQRKPLKEYGI
jgi:uncharacterized protein YndB with AHSA1/START domain